MYLRPRQAGARQQVLVNTDRPVYLTALAQEVTQGDMGLQCFGVDFQCIDKRVHSTVGTAIKQIV